MSSSLKSTVLWYGYQVLHTPVIDFEIQQLVLNPTSKLLAVMGRSQVALVVLPRKGWNNIVGSRIECRYVDPIHMSAGCGGH